MPPPASTSRATALDAALDQLDRICRDAEATGHGPAPANAASEASSALWRAYVAASPAEKARMLDDHGDELAAAAAAHDAAAPVSPTALWLAYLAACPAEQARMLAQQGEDLEASAVAYDAAQAGR